MKLKGNKKDKRKSLKLQKNITKRANNLKRKTRRECKKAAKAGLLRTKQKKDPGIPNSYPFKKELLAELEQKKLKKEREKEAEIAKSQRHQKWLKQQKRKEELQEKKNTLALLQARADKKAKAFDKEQAANSEDKNATFYSQDAENSRKSFYRKLRTVVSNSDIVVQVLDARDPNSCRSPVLEREILTQGKKIVLLLNKVDLVPKESVQAWLKYLRRFYPTIAFKSARAKGQVNQADTSYENASEGLLRGNMTVIGADTLMQLLKNYARSGDRKSAITVGIIGYPNVGKSSVINSMKRSAVVKTGASAGVTREVQEVQLDSKVKLLDSPGVVFSGASEDPAVVIRNATNIDQLKDPAGVVSALMQRTPKEALMRHFELPHFTDVVSFLVAVSKARGKVKKGGVRDLTTAARHVLTEWATGKIRYYSMPPKDGRNAPDRPEDADKVTSVGEMENSIENEASIVQSFSPEFDIEALFKKEDEILDKELSSAPARAVCMTGDSFGQDPEHFESCDEEMDQDEQEESGSEAEGMMCDDDELLNATSELMVAPTLPKKKVARASKRVAKNKKDKTTNAHNQQKTTEMRKMQKKQEKLKRKCGLNVPIGGGDDDI